MKSKNGFLSLKSMGFSSGFFLVFLLSHPLFSAEDDYDFLPAHAWNALGETGEDDATTRLSEGFEGQKSEPTKNTTIEPVDGAGGFDNVAPRLGAEDGPGGLEWDPSPTYRTRFKGGTDYLAGSGTRLQGNNWFLRIPYLTYDTGTNQYRVRFDANTFRVYTNLNASTWVGQFGNLNSKIVKVGSDLYLYDTRGKLFFFPQVNGFRCSIITGLGGSRIEISYGTDITVLQKPNGNSGSEVRKFVYTVTSNRIDKIDIYDTPPSLTHRYRTVDFTYHENVTGAVESTTGDLIGIEDQTLLSDGTSWRSQKWGYKYFTGTYNSSTNPGYPYQVKAVLGPQSVHDFEKANPSTVIYTQTAAQLASYVDRQYEYASDKRVRQIDFKQGCGCGSGEGIYGYAFDVNGSTPTDLKTCLHRATITLPSVNGSSRIIDYNKYGQLLNHIAQEVAGNSNSRRWIQTFAHDTTGRLTDSYSVKACTSYTDSTHTVTTNTTAGQRFQYAYDSNSALTTIKLRNPSNGNWNFQRKKAFSFLTSGDRRRFVNTGDTAYPTETTTDTGGLTTSYAYTYHTADALAVKKRTTTMPIVQTSENGSGSAIVLYDYFEPDGLHTWRKDGDAFVHYTMFDANARTMIKEVRDINTASPPSTTPAI